MSIAFFDFDKTLIAGNSASIWLKTMWNKRQISIIQALGASYWLVRYHFGFANVESGLDKALSYLKGYNAADFAAGAKIFYEASIKELYRPLGLETIESHRAAGHEVALLSSIPDLISKLVASDLKLDAYLCTRLKIDENGFYTGGSVGPICFGKGKLAIAQDYAAKKGVSLKDCAFYSDSMSDSPVLEAVGNPVAVNPDPRLRKEAKKNGWKIVDWGI